MLDKKRMEGGIALFRLAFKVAETDADKRAIEGILDAIRYVMDNDLPENEVYQLMYTAESNKTFAFDKGDKEYWDGYRLACKDILEIPYEKEEN